MKINNIEEAVIHYKDVLSKDEIGLCETFFEMTGDIDETVLVFEKLKYMAHGLATGYVDPKMVDWVREKIAVATISNSLNISTKYFENLPVDTQNELLDCYEENINSDDLKEKLWKIANIIVEKKTDNKTEVVQESAEEPKPQQDTPTPEPIKEPPPVNKNEQRTEQPKASIIKKLAYYREVVLKKYQNGEQK